MLFDIIFGIFVAGLIGMSSNGGTVSHPDDALLTPMPPPALPSGEGVLPLPAAPAPGRETESQLTNWPVQIKLVPTRAPYSRGRSC